MTHVRNLGLALVLLGIASWAPPASACSDNQNCGPAASPIRKLYDSCSALPVLAPGNDSRVNLWLLEDDAHPLPLQAKNGRADITPTDLWPVPFSYSVLISAALPPPPESRREGGVLSTQFARGEGTRCVSEARGRAEFEAAVQAAALSPEEKSALVALRAATGEKCGVGAKGQDTGQAREAIKSDLGLAFLRYIDAASAFYSSGFDEALSDYRALSGAQDPWLKESAAYMIGRALLNKGQIGAFGLDNTDSEPRAKDIDSLKSAEQAFDAYLKAYPDGRYAASAHGLMRRLYWLENDQSRLVGAYARLVEQKSADAAARFDLAEEIDYKMIIPGLTKTHDPVLLATLDLIRMRSDEGKAQLSAAELAAQAPDFEGRKALYDYLRAARAYYVDNDAMATLELLGPPSQAPGQTNLDFSREFLRGLALNALGDASAEALWKSMIAGADRPWRRETAELGLAWYWERARTANKVFMPDSPVRSGPIREILLRNVAGPILLRQQADDKNASLRERGVARFTLLYKDATHGHYAGFLKDYAAAEPFLDDKTSYLPAAARGLGAFRWQGQNGPIVCPSLKDVMEKLAASPKDPRALLCLGEFVRTQGFDQFELDTPPPADQLGGEKSIFPGAPFSRGEIYKALIADPATPDDARAYAYFRAIHCYEPSGVNGCGGVDVNKSVRKTWYDALKRRYGALPYVKALRYYW
jgi:hypothetical protein